VSQEKLPLYYSAADVLIVPSIHEEGFGRVILEALSCGTPVIASKRGGITEAIDETVGEFIHVDAKTITKAVHDLSASPKLTQEKARRANAFAHRNFSQKNADVIIASYR
jgi:glycosyltransferase involved in cell wall biosynthesis